MGVTTRSSKSTKKGGSDKIAVAKKAKGAVKARKGSDVGKVKSSALSQTEKVLSAAHSTQCIGAMLPRNWHRTWSIHEPLTKLLLDNPFPSHSKKSVWVFLMSESLDKHTHEELIKRNGDENVPIVVVIYSDVCPISYGATFSLQLQEKNFFPLSEKSLHWNEKQPRINILKTSSTGIFGAPSFDYMHLPLSRPSLMRGKVPDEVAEVSINYKGKKICASKKSDVDAYIEDDEALDDDDQGKMFLTPEEDREKIIALLKEEKSLQKSEMARILKVERDMFGSMIDALVESEGMAKEAVEAKLESMKIYKVYPSNLPPTKKTWAGETGFRKNLMVNRFLGNADGFY